MTLSPLDLLAQVSLTLVIALALTGGVIVYVRKLHRSIMQAIAGLQQAVIGLQQTSTSTADEQHTQTALLGEMLRQLTEQTKVLIIGNKPRLLQAEADQRGMVMQQELATFLTNSGFFSTADGQSRLLAYLPGRVLALIDQRRYPGQSIAALMTTIVRAAAEYSQIPTLCATASNMFNSSQTGQEFATRCAQWGIRLPPHTTEREPDDPT